MIAADTGATVAVTLGSLAGPGSRVLVVGRGSAARQVVRACRRHEMSSVFVTGFSTKPDGEERIAGAPVAVLGAKESPQLWRNAHALAGAAHSCDASILLFADRGSAPSKYLLSQAQLNGWRVLLPLEGDHSGEYWEECALPSGVEPWEPQWRTCPKCRLTIDVAQEGLGKDSCPECGALFRLDSQERIDEVFDAGSFEEWDAVLPEPDPLGFPGYGQVLERNRKRSGREEAVRCGSARLYGLPVAACVMESSFMMGSMGSVVGEKVTRCVERATAQGLPLVIFCASGGARMQEGLASLMQMAKTTAALEAHGRAGLPYFSVLTDPTTGGVTASFAMLGDVIVAEPGALIGFAGRRVIQDTIKQTLPESFQSAEFALEHGLVDAIVERSQLRGYLAQLVRLYMASTPGGDDYLHRPLAPRPGRDAHGGDRPWFGDSPRDPFGDRPRLQKGDRPLVTVGRKPALALRVLGGVGGAIKQVASLGGRMSGGQERELARALRKRGVVDAPGPCAQPAEGGGHAWESVQLARNVHRPTSAYYIGQVFDGFIELHGDRCLADDGAILCGVAWLAGKPVTVIAEEKGATLEQRIARNFGCPQPEGYRKAMRMMRQAEKFGRPVVCLVDTQGAFCGKEAEERGMGAAIAQSMSTLAGLTVPVVCAVIGEGGSGGALALAVGNRVAMQEHAVYSVLSPEGFASILWKDGSRAPEAAEVMKMSAAEARELGVVEDVLSEGTGPAHENPDQAAAELKSYLARSLDELRALSGEELRAQRHARFRAF